MPKDFGRRLPVDSRIVDSIERSPRMSAEQGAGFMKGWGGPGMYQEMARWPVTERVTYHAVLEGHTAQDQIEVATGLTSKEVSRALTGLQRKGYVEVGEVGK